LCHPHGAYFYSTQEDEISDFISAVSEFPNINCTLNRSKAAVSVYCGQTKKCKGNSLMKWLEKMNLLNKTAISKFIPDEVFGWKHEDQVVFLAKLWQGDGCVSIKNFQTYYATSSARLAKDVQHLLLRFGINSTIYKKSFKYRDGIKIGYTVVITHKENILSFFDAIDPYLIGKKKEEIKKLSKIIGPSASDKVEARGTKDVIPAEILIIIKKEMFRRGVTINELSKKSGLSKRLFSVDIRKKGFTRKTIGKIAKFLNSEILKQYANSDVYWDEIISITSAGKEMTYDLSVPPHANFVANDIIIHNSHAASYGRVAYQTAYMKCNFPAEYMCSVLTHQRGEVEDVAVMVEECKRMGIPVLPPDINESFEDFTVVKSAASSEQRVARENEDANTKDKIRFGLTTIKNFGEGIGQSIISERKSGGHFKSISDFLSRVKDKNLNKKSLESLIKAGAFDSLADRFDLLHNLDRLLQFSKEERGKESDQSSLFSIMSEVHKTEELSLDPAPENERNSADKLLWEKELLGLYISGHPLDSFRDKLLGREINIKKLKEKSREKEPVVLAGIVEEIKPIMTKKGDKMVFLKISDLSDSIECVVFPKVYEEFQDMLASESCIVIKGTISKRNDEKSIVIEKVKMLE
jgi:DNA polymerase-3 subunit alpha